MKKTSKTICQSRSRDKQHVNLKAEKRRKEKGVLYVDAKVVLTRQEDDFFLGGGDEETNERRNERNKFIFKR